MAELGFEIRVAGAGELHDAVADNTGNDAAHGGEGKKEGLRIPRLRHHPSPCPTHFFSFFFDTPNYNYEDYYVMGRDIVIKLQLSIPGLTASPLSLALTNSFTTVLV